MKIINKSFSIHLSINVFMNKKDYFLIYPLGIETSNPLFQIEIPRTFNSEILKKI